MTKRHRSILESREIAIDCVFWLIVFLLAALAMQLLSFPSSNGDRQALASDEFTTPIPTGQVGGTYSTGGQLRTVTDTYASVNLVANGGCEEMLATNNWVSWAEVAVGGTTITEGNVVGEYHNGTNAVKFTSAEIASNVYKQFTVVPYRTYTFTFFTRGDGSVQGRYHVWDVSNPGYLLGFTNTGVTSTSYAAVTNTFTTPAGCVTVRIMLFGSTSGTGTVYYDDLSCYPTTGLCSVEDGKLKFAGGKASPGWGDPGVWWPAVARTSGLTVRGTLNQAATTTIGAFGFDAGTSGAVSAGFSTAASAVLNFTDSADRNIGTYAAETDYPLAVQAGVSKWFAYVSESGVWKLRYISHLNVSDATIYPALSGNTAALTLDNLDVRIRPLPVPLASDSFDRADGALGSTDGQGHTEMNGGGLKTWNTFGGTLQVCGNAVTNTSLSNLSYAGLDCLTPNVIVMASIYETNAAYGALWAKLSGTLGYSNSITARVLTNNVYYLRKYVNGVVTTVSGGAATYSNGSRLMLICDGSEVRLYYNNVYIVSGTVSDVEILNNKIHGIGIYNDVAGSTANIDNCVIFARGNEGQYSYMGDRR